MKFTSSLSALLVLLPVLSQVAAVVVPSEPGLVARQRGGRGGNRGGNAAAGKGGNANAGAANAGNANNGAAASSSAATAANTAAAGNANNGNNGNNGNANANTGDPQTSLTLDPKVIAPGFANNGQDQPVDGQVASLTSTNNFINFCLTVPNLPITNGQQVQGGSCNPAPIGVIPSVDKMPAAKFQSPANMDTIKADTEFTISMALNNLQAGNFVNAQENYFAAPQQVNGQGLIIGHTHVVIEKLDSLTQTTPTNPQDFVFFKGVNTAQVNGAVTADVTSGVPAGAYRLCSINSSSNHQPVIVPIAQHGSLDDCVYFTATADGQAAGGNANAGNANAGNANAGAANNGTANAGGNANAGNANAGNANAGNNKGGNANAGNANAGAANAGNANAGNANAGNANAGNANAGAANAGKANAGAANAGNANAGAGRGGRGGRRRSLSRL